uniref:Anthocyanidin 3-O-glucosyltransferase n=1 Tax=Manihot esculenta TaxID=3983 RepID=A0A199UBM0_MANES
MDDAVVMFPSPAIGHFISMVELGKLILTFQPSLSIHTLIVSAPYSAGSTASYVADVAATTPSVSFHRLPTITLPSSTNTHYETLIFEVLRLSNPHVHQALLSISKTHKIKAFIMDFFYFFSLSIASQLNIPGYFFFTSGAGSLAASMYFPTLHQTTTKSFKDMNTFLNLPGLPPISSSNFSSAVSDRNNKAYEYFLDMAYCFPKSAGVIVNTFAVLEARALKAMSDGLCIPDSTTPPVYCTGPLVVTNNQTDGDTECLNWLESQLSQSVIFLCFGSLGLFSMEQLREIASGLERSGQRFLWVVRNPPSDSQSLDISALPEPDLNSLLPDGFLDRTKEKGLVVKSWAPQVAVLNHNAGVPMVAWPLYAEQKFNRLMLVEEMKIALPMKEDEKGFVTGLEVEKRVNELMQSDSGKSVRERTIAVKNSAKAALSEGGSSRVAMSRLVESWKH